MVNKKIPFCSFVSINEKVKSLYFYIEVFFNILYRIKLLNRIDFNILINDNLAKNLGFENFDCNKINEIFNNQYSENQDKLEKNILPSSCIFDIISLPDLLTEISYTQDIVRDNLSNNKGKTIIIAEAERKITLNQLFAFFNKLDNNKVIFILHAILYEKYENSNFISLLHLLSCNQEEIEYSTKIKEYLLDCVNDKKLIHNLENLVISIEKLEENSDHKIKTIKIIEYLLDCKKRYKEEDFLQNILTILTDLYQICQLKEEDFLQLLSNFLTIKRVISFNVKTFLDELTLFNWSHQGCIEAFAQNSDVDNIDNKVFVFDLLELAEKLKSGFVNDNDLLLFVVNCDLFNIFKPIGNISLLNSLFHLDCQKLSISLLESLCLDLQKRKMKMLFTTNINDLANIANIPYFFNITHYSNYSKQKHLIENDLILDNSSKEIAIQGNLIAVQQKSFCLKHKKSLSPTAIQLLNQNPNFFFLKHILNFKYKDNINSVFDSKIFGSTLHLAIEKFAYFVKYKDIFTIEDFLKLTESVFSETLNINIKDNIFLYNKIYQIGQKVLKIEQNAKQTNQNVNVEYRVFFDLKIKSIQAIIDRIEVNLENKSCNLYDFKSGNSPTLSEELNGMKTQLLLIAYLINKYGINYQNQVIQEINFIQYISPNEDDLCIEKSQLKEYYSHIENNLTEILDLYFSSETIHIDHFAYQKQKNNQYEFEENKYYELFNRAHRFKRV